MSTGPYGWLDFEQDESTDAIPNKLVLTILDPDGEEMAVIVHRVVGDPYASANGHAVDLKRADAELIVAALNHYHHHMLTSSEPTERKDTMSNQYRDAVATANAHETWVCPRCDHPTSDFPALSRKDNTTAVCSRCGTEEAMRQFHGQDPWPADDRWPFDPTVTVVDPRYTRRQR